MTQITEHTWEMFEIGPFVITLHEDLEFKQTTLYCEKGGWPQWNEPFYGDTVEEAWKRAAQRCITIFEKWAEEARKLCQI